MKNITHLQNLQKCMECKCKGFFTYTPQNGLFTTCGSCGTGDFYNTTHDKSYKIYFNKNYNNDDDEDDDDEDDDNDDNDNKDDNRINFLFCGECKIIYKRGSEHFKGNILDEDIYNMIFIKKWKDKRNGVEYIGMPQFDDEKEWFENVNSIEVLELFCPHNDAKCSSQKN